MKMTNKWLQETLALWESDLAYHDQKKEAHRRAKRLLNAFALLVGIPEDKFSVRSNLAGPAVSGEVTLHSDPMNPGAAGIYVQIGQTYPFASGGCSILYRTCRDRADYTGGQNWWRTGVGAFGSIDRCQEFAENCKILMRGRIVDIFEKSND